MPIRKVFLAAALLLTTAVFADDVASRKEVFHNDQVAAYRLDIPPQQASTYRREKDNLTVFVSGARAGETQYKHANAIQNVRNDDAGALRAVVLEFTAPQGEAISEMRPARRQCAEGSRTACVEEKHLFCTKTLCAEDVRMGPQATRGGFASDDAQMLVAVSDYALSDALGGGGAPKHSRTSGQVEWIPAGAPNRWTNTADAPAHFILIRFGANP
jgi:hypothetical protein